MCKIKNPWCVFNFSNEAAKVVGSEKTRIITSQHKPNGNDSEIESDANWNKGKRSHMNPLSKLKQGSCQRDLNKKGRVGILQSGEKENRRDTERPFKGPISNSWKTAIWAKIATPLGRRQELETRCEEIWRGKLD